MTTQEYMTELTQRAEKYVAANCCYTSEEERQNLITVFIAGANSQQIYNAMVEPYEGGTAANALGRTSPPHITPCGCPISHPTIKETANTLKQKQTKNFMTPTLKKEIDVFKLLEEYADQQNLSGIELLIEIINYFENQFDHYIPDKGSKELAIALNQATPLWCKNKTNREYELVETGCYYDD